VATSRRPLRLALLGFGNVGRYFVGQLAGAYGRVLHAAGVEPLVTGIATGRHGVALDRDGLALSRALRLVKAGQTLTPLHRGAPIDDADAFIARVRADVLLELTPLVPTSGEPALGYVRAALARGLHVVTANKGPVAFGRRRLMRLAARQGVQFRHEGVVMDGFPIFNLTERCLPGTRILGFRGLLNSTTTRILGRMEAGLDFDAALAEAQAAGVAEADPRHDIDGWDAAVKACALANALMDADIRPDQVERRGIGGLGSADVGAALARGCRLRLIVRARRRAGRLHVSVGPESLPQDDVLVSSGADGVLVLETDLMREVGLWEGAGGVDQTAYALLADLVAIARSA
jgi:homoserine dehydrogenase